jgi:hypothetical protein
VANVTRKIGLSLGADICWPICYEQIVSQLDLKIPLGGDRIDFEVERVSIEPFDLRQPCSYDVVIDRLTHWLDTSREWIKKSIIMDGLYVFNNPWSVQSMEKCTTYCAMMHLGLPIPETWLIPPKAYEPSTDLDATLQSYAKLFSLEDLGEKLTYPLFIKPYNTGGWVGVSKIDDGAMLKSVYDDSGKLVMHLQKAVLPYELFVRAIGVGPQVNVIKYDPTAPLHGRYNLDSDFLSAEDESLLRDMVLTINAFFGWDFNSCECLLHDGVYHPIDFANPCPDSQVTSLHYHFPWMLMSKIRWSIFCAATKRPFKRNLDWAPYYAVRERGLPYREQMREYGKLADAHFDTERFNEFCQTHLAHLHEVTWEFFGSPAAKDAVHRKVEALFPDHEVEEFTEHFWGLLQSWRKAEQDRRDPSEA